MDAKINRIAVNGGDQINTLLSFVSGCFKLCVVVARDKGKFRGTQRSWGEGTVCEDVW